MGVKDQILEHKMLLVPLSLRKLQRFLELWPGSRDIYFLLYHSITVAMDVSVPVFGVCVQEFLSSTCPEVEMLDHWVFVSSTSMNNAELLFRVVLPIFTPTSSIWEFLLLHIAYSWYCLNFSSLSKMCSGRSLQFWYAFP